MLKFNSFYRWRLFPVEYSKLIYFQLLYYKIRPYIPWNYMFNYIVNYMTNKCLQVFYMLHLPHLFHPVVIL